MTYVAIALYLLAMPMAWQITSDTRPDVETRQCVFVSAIWPLIVAAYLACKAGEAFGFEWAKRTFRQ